MDNAGRLKRRGKLLPDWSKAEFCHVHVSVPFISPRGKIYYYQVFMCKSELQEPYQFLWGQSKIIDQIEIKLCSA